MAMGTFQERGLQSIDVSERQQVAFFAVLDQHIFEVDECGLSDCDIVIAVVADDE